MVDVVVRLIKVFRKNNSLSCQRVFIFGSNLFYVGVSFILCRSLLYKVNREFMNRLVVNFKYIDDYLVIIVKKNK